MTNSSKDHFGRLSTQEFRANLACLVDRVPEITWCKTMSKSRFKYLYWTTSDRLRRQTTSGTNKRFWEIIGLYHLVVYERSLQVQVVIKSKQHAHLWLVYTYLQSTYFLMFFAILCAPIVDGHAVYFLLLPGPGGIIHKLLQVSCMIKLLTNAITIHGTIVIYFDLCPCQTIVTATVELK